MGRNRELRHVQTFVLQKPYFVLYTAAKSGKASICADDTVAGDNDRDGIVAHGTAHCLGRHMRFIQIRSCLPGDLAVSGDLPVGNLAEKSPDFLAKRAS